MAGSKEGGIKAAKTNIEKYGKDFYKNIGRIGGSAYTDKAKGFAANPELAKKVASGIGYRTKKGYKWLGDIDKKHGKYENKETGMIEIKEYSRELD